MRQGNVGDAADPDTGGLLTTNLDPHGGEYGRTAPDELSTNGHSGDVLSTPGPNSNTDECKLVWVQVPPPAPHNLSTKAPVRRLRDDVEESDGRSIDSPVD